MKDKRRIQRIIKLLERQWLICPDLRFWQLLSWIQTKLPLIDQDDPFYVNDKLTENLLSKPLS